MSEALGNGPAQQVEVNALEGRVGIHPELRGHARPDRLVPFERLRPAAGAFQSDEQPRPQ